MTVPANSILSFERLKQIVYPGSQPKPSELHLSSSEGDTMSGFHSSSVHNPHSHHIPAVLDPKQPEATIPDDYSFTNSNQHVSSPTHSQSSHSVDCNESTSDHPSYLFFSDISGTSAGASSPSRQGGDSIPSYTYCPQATLVLGSTDDNKCAHPSTIRRCFNCGDATHGPAGCQEPRNEALIRLSRQIFQAQKLTTHGEADEDCNQANHSLSADIGVNPLDRQRELAASFFPGQVSAGLREALFWDSNLECADPDFMDPERPMPWYDWFEKWGYPPGYAIHDTDKLDPFEAVTHRLAELDQDHTWTSTQVLEMHRGESPPPNSNEEGYDSDEEVLRLLLPKRAVSSVSILPNLPLNVTNIDAPLPPSPPLLPSSSSGQSRRLRIVKYSGARFCHDHLPVYNGQMLKRKQTCKCPSTAYYSAETSKSRYSEDLRKRQLPPTRPSSSRRFAPYPPARPSYLDDTQQSRKNPHWKGVTKEVDVSPESSTTLPRRSHPHSSSAADTSDKFFDGCPRRSNSRFPAPSHVYSQRSTSLSPWRSSRDPSSTEHSNATPGSSIFRPSFHPYTSPSLISPPLLTRNREMTNVPTDENMAWYTALLPDYPESTNSATSAPIPQDTARASNGSTSPALYAVSRALTPSSHVLSEAEAEPQPESEDMVMSDESDE